MILNHQFHQNKQPAAKTLVFVHGLFGSLSNLGMLARELYSSNHVLQVDVRNHGLSAHSNVMNYEVMATDLIETLDELNIEHFSLIGHSMGGKLVMKVTELAGDRLDQLVVLDITPIAYKENHHEQIFKALFAVQKADIETRQQAIEIMREYLKEEMVIQFLLKSFSKGRWLFNVDALYQNYAQILSWENIETWHKSALFIRGGNSPYVEKPEYIEAIQSQFSQAQIQTVADAGHWLHAEKTAQVLQIITQYLSQPST
ncbi:alpha/beta fold hydrolase [Acinetobacter johnsonii]|uniref:Alpha/beta fold hydrolase n=1 Tax=Acinetobacter johnsonii TaxID=40214 RepID=A0AA42QPK8_ACIJO|nr:MULTISPECIES: alpha/beta fold hydrolase [Acinetobacter]MBC6677380.1 alpha/beta fold hydrolase [Acinetobacter sp.]MBK5646475.1 alpha/beta fold hydrolase [Acinetobacter sp.]MDH1364847.1 alpha/beta fold hydrolase [Acinetobacter johnsonii]MDH1438395.1 alpha/beta fold hydrolase [Acinetobacter johnsonii]HAE64630.1 alpha/beta hydrolase [Acinetobacter johnsonii]